MGIKDRFAICGLGVTRQGRIPGVSSVGFSAEAIHLAIQDAGLRPEDVDGYIYQGLQAARVGAAQLGEVPKHAGVPVKFIWQMQSGGATAVSAVVAACGALEAGAANYVVIVYGSAVLSLGSLIGGTPENARSNQGAYGLFAPGPDHALAARRHMYEFGTTHRQLGAIAVTQREYANKRPEAYMHGRPMTLEDHVNSRIIADPLHMLDFCLNTDGGVALIVTTAERAKQCKSKPVYIMGAGLGHQVREHYSKTQYTRLNIDAPKEAAFREAGVTVKDIDVAELYDCFTITVLLELEDYGFCKKGEGGPYVEAGGMKIGGPGVPTNTAGGELSWAYLQGFTPLTEGIRQMRGEGGDTQAPNAKIGLVSGHGGTGTGSMAYAHGTLVLRRD